MTFAEDSWMADDQLDVEQEIAEALPIVLGASNSELAPEALDDLFARATAPLSTVEAESLGKALRTVGRWAAERGEVRQLAGTVLPAAATAAGTAIGGPVGAIVGREVGQRAGRAIGGATQRAAGRAAAGPAGTGSLAAPAAPFTDPASSSEPIGGAPPAAPAPAAAGAVPPPEVPRQDGSQAAARLLYLVQHPAFLSKLIALVLGRRGEPAVPVDTGGPSVGVGAFLNAASTLTAQAAQDAESLLPWDAFEGDADSDSYLRDAAGALCCDPAVPEQRANVLLARLEEADHALAESTPSDDEAEWAESWWDDETWEDGESWSHADSWSAEDTWRTDE